MKKYGRYILLSLLILLVGCSESATYEAEDDYFKVEATITETTDDSDTKFEVEAQLTPKQPMEAESFHYQMVIEPLGTSEKTEDYDEVVELEALTIRDTFTSEEAVSIDDFTLTIKVNELETTYTLTR
ncbi:hypothetical protein HMI01_06690 [Halolactibacillus miurensis]|uniref:Uncharacterized protein n=1 Tax=Halolactibacillus miurensis TaxID=306541 RepID=A0A1I6R107_9BACI|nr:MULTISPECIES: hypothetical protein [Halolactibacillus]GEM03681.1 hypothetical protein HMI01_06690 [Halolactibacillus miurensis]SFS58300.1 hypothetical protein SAMN05421668_1058 [Halolactibacillus miurensis]